MCPKSQLSGVINYDHWLVYQDVYKFEIVVENGVTVPPRGERRISGVGESFYVVLKLAENLDQGLHNFFYFYFFFIIIICVIFISFS